MDKNSVIGFILIIAVLFGFTFLQGKRAQKQQEYEMHVRDSIARLQPEVESTPIEEAAVPEESVPSADDFKVPVYKDALLDSASSRTASVVTLRNDVFELAFTTKGAQPLSVKLNDFYNYDSTDLYIFKPGGSEYSISVYAGEYIRTSDFVFEVAEHTDTTVVMRLPFAGGGYIEQKYSIHEGSYAVDNLLSFVDMGGVIPKNVSSFDIDYNVDIPRMEKGFKNESQYSKLNYYFDSDKKPSEIGRGRSSSKRIDSKLSWFAYQQQFFSAIMRAPRQFASGELSVNFYQENDPERKLMRCCAAMRSELPSGSSSVSVPFEFYFGPNHFSTLESFGQKYEKIIPLGGWLVGWFTRYAIIPMFNIFHRFIDNFGLVILLMTIVIKIVVFPLTYKSYASSAKMQALKPEMDKINAKYPNANNQQDQLKKQQATMDLYKRAGVSPMGGCLPTLLTFPILWAMFRFFPASIELRQQPFLWCDDLSSYDAILEYGVRIPIFGDHLSLFALLMAVTMWFYSKMTLKSQPNAGDPTASSMKFMSLWMMPIMMFFICNSLSAALSYYYLLSQLIAMIQTWAIRKSIDPQKILDKVHASEGKPLPKSKWQQRLEQAQKMQQQQLEQQRRAGRR